MPTLRRPVLLSLMTAVAFAVSACGGGGGADSAGNSSGSGTDSTTDSSTATVYDKGAWPAQSTAVVAGDLNGDGWPDLIVGARSSGSERYAAPQVYLHNGTAGGFTQVIDALPTQYLGTAASAMALKVRDVNGDGKPDLLAMVVDQTAESYLGRSRVQLFLGSGNGRFTDASDLVANGTWPGSHPCSASTDTGWKGYPQLRIADFDGDGIADLVPVNDVTSGNAIWRGNGSGGFAPATVTLYREAEDGTVTVENDDERSDKRCFNGAGWGLRSAVAIDVDQDGKTDLVQPLNGSVYRNISTAGDLRFVVLWHTLPVSAFNPTTLLTQAEPIDLDADGRADLLTWPVNGADQPHALRSLGNGRFELADGLLPSTRASLGQARHLMVGDVDGDGRPDALFSTASGPQLLTSLGLSTGLADRTGLLPEAARALPIQGAATASLYGDGRPVLFLSPSAGLASSAGRLWRQLTDGDAWRAWLASLAWTPR